MLQEQPNATLMPLAKIRAGKNPRRYFDRRKHEDLVAGFRLRGMLQPMLLRPSPDEPEAYTIVAGERRFRAALEAFGADGEAPAIVRDMTDQEALEAAIDENENRDDASETEQADAAVRHLAACQGDKAEAARRLGWSQSKLDRRLALANLSEAVKTALDERRIKVGHAELLAAVPSDKQDKALDTIITASLDVAKTRELLMRVTQSLGAAVFDKTECTTCPFNSGSQRALFETHVDDGHCTNAGCYGLKTEAADKAREEAAAAAAPPPPPPPAPSEAKQSATAGKGAVEAPKPATAGAPAASPAMTKPATPAPAAPAPKVTAKSIAARVTDLREAAWRKAVARALAVDAGHAQAVILTAAMAGTLAQIKAETLTARAALLIGDDFPKLDFAEKMSAVLALPTDKVAVALSAIGAAYAKDAADFGHIAALAAGIGIDLRDSWRVDETFLRRLGKEELKFVAQEVGLVAHMGAKPFARLLEAKTDAIAAGMLNATGFEWPGRLPSAMTLDGKYGAPPANTSSPASGKDA